MQQHRTDPKGEDPMPARLGARFAMARHAFSRVILAMVAGAALGSFAASAHAAEKVIFAWVPAIDALPYMVALEEKAFEKVGIEVVDQRLNSPAGLVDAFIADRAEVGPYGTAPGIAMVAESQHPGSLKIFGLSGGAADTPYVNSTL